MVSFHQVNGFAAIFSLINYVKMLQEGLLKCYKQEAIVICQEASSLARTSTNITLLHNREERAPSIIYLVFVVVKIIDEIFGLE